MPTPVLPQFIYGPAALMHNGFTFYSEKGFKRQYKRNTFNIRSDIAGQIDNRLEYDLEEISWSPDGQIGTIAKYFPYNATHIGKSIFGIATPDDTVVIHTLAGQKYTWTRGAISKLPKLSLCPTKPLFGDMTITCIGKSAAQRTAADFWRTIAAVGFTDATFDETKIKTALYTAAYGASPYDAMGSLEGFEIEPTLETKLIKSCDWGVGDIQVQSLSVAARFRPNSLTPAQVETLLARQNTGALYPGESVSKGNTDLAITSDAFTATLPKMGPVSFGENFMMGEHQHDVLEFQNKVTWSTGVRNALWTFTAL